ncbi:MAG: ribonuclease III [Tissierellia bacterium]|nr:ribonuclease III [Tissierellia bacterium]
MKRSSKRQTILSEMQSSIEYNFNDPNLLDTALTHSSYVNENRMRSYESNERLEFLGDAVINLVISQYLYENFYDLPEGELTKRRAAIVCEPSLASAARGLGLGKYLLLGKGEEGTGGRDRDSTLADAFEALIGAIYIDGGLEHANRFILDIFDNETIHSICQGDLLVDYKTRLQEKLQRGAGRGIEYIVERETGPDHDKRFYINAVIDDEILGKGMGKNKKEAEQNAAKEALYNMDKSNG